MHQKSIMRRAASGKRIVRIKQIYFIRSVTIQILFLILRKGEPPLAYISYGL